MNYSLVIKAIPKVVVRLLGVREIAQEEQRDECEWTFKQVEGVEDDKGVPHPWKFIQYGLSLGRHQKTICADVLQAAIRVG